MPHSDRNSAVADQPSTTNRPDTSPDGQPLDLGDVLETALRAGQIMLENGAGTARVEETVRRLGTSLGAEQVEVFATPTGLFATDSAGGEHRTRIQRIARAELDLSKIEAVLAVSRAVVAGQYDLAAAMAALEQVAAAPRPFNLGVTTLTSGIGCACSALLLGGGVAETVATALGAGLGHLVVVLLGRAGLSSMMAVAVAAAVATGTALGVALMLGAAFPAVAMSASILMLTPGVLLVSAISDLFRGDTLAGVARLATALLMVAGIAAGSWMILAISGASLALGGLLPPDWASSLALAAVMTITFGMMFGVPRPRALPCILAGVAGYAASRLGEAFGAPPGVAIFLGGLAVGLLAEVLARTLRAPASIFSVPGIITLVPGGVAFRTMLAFAQGDTPAGTADLVRTALFAGALAAGLGTVTALAALKLRRT